MSWRWSPYFEPVEVLSPAGMRYYNKRGQIQVQGSCLDALVAWRVFWNSGIIINSKRNKRRGYRSVKEAREVYKQKKRVIYGAHVQGIAFDQTPIRESIFDFTIGALLWNKKRLFEDKMPFRAIGIYPAMNFMHGDFRTLRYQQFVIWNGNKSITVVLQDKDLIKMTAQEIADFLKSNLNVPKKWSIANEKKILELEERTGYVS